MPCLRRVARTHCTPTHAHAHTLAHHTLNKKEMLLGLVSLPVALLVAIAFPSVAATTSLSEPQQQQPEYVLGAQGADCTSTCMVSGGQVCVPHIDTNNNTQLFSQLGINCSADRAPAQNGKWWAADQPSFVTDQNDPNFNECLGYIGVPTVSPCGASESAVRRICHCGGSPPALGNLTFGTGLSGGGISGMESTVFWHRIPAGHVGQMNHFWSTCSAECEANLVVRYYIDGEKLASIAFRPSMAAGSGFNDAESAPRGTKWMGVGAGKGGSGQAWFHNFKIPFGSSVRVTTQTTNGASYGGFYLIVRGGLDLPLVLGEVPLPSTARLELQKFEGPLAPLAFLDVVSVPRGREGQIFLTALSVNNSGTGGLNFLEGCYHMYDPPETPWPGTVLATGTEDFFDSGWYFNSGEFYMPVSGMTHKVTTPKLTEWSAYRTHEMDPLRFSDGVRMQWRCGDLSAPAPNGGGKCYSLTEGKPVGSPTCENVISYGWVYTWPKRQSYANERL